jgi:thiamine biosynthesis protein ThiS
MMLRLNGNMYEYQGDGSLTGLLLEMKANPEHVAVMVNEKIISKAERDGLTLKDDDVVELLTFMGGG